VPSESRVSVNSTPHLGVQPSAWVGAAPLIVLTAAVIALRLQFPPWAFMWLLAVSIFAGLKWATWWRARVTTIHTFSRSVAYLLTWPGMDAETFLDSQRQATRPRPQEWLWAAAKAIFGVVLLWLVARRAGAPLLQGWIGLLGLVLLLHFGSFHLIALFWQACGIDAQPIMAKPVLSNTLSEFWGKRWNLGFRQLAYDLIFRPLHRHIGIAAASLLVFLFSGLIHDLVISLPARGGYGLPTGYFVLQGLGVTLERSSMGRRLGLQHGFLGWLFMVIFTAAPAFWLFHPHFVMRVILPFMHAIGAL
jgi:Membrane bound O-acyl transferase family